MYEGKTHLRYERSTEHQKASGTTVTVENAKEGHAKVETKAHAEPLKLQDAISKFMFSLDYYSKGLVRVKFKIRVRVGIG